MAGRRGRTKRNSNSQHGDKATLHDVARLSRVSIATVSRVVNGHRQILPRTRRRVLHAIELLGYQPNVHARRLVTQSVETIGFLLSNRDFLNPFHAGVLTGVEHAAADLRHEILYASCTYAPTTPPAELELPPILRSRGLVGGVILAGTNYPNLLRAVRERGIPHIVFGNNLIGPRQTPEADSVFYDDAASSLALVERLIALGHRRIAFAGDIRQPWFARRRAAYRQAMARCQLPPMEYTAPLDSPHGYVDYGEAALRQLLARRSPPTALFAGNDNLAFGAWRLCRKLGLRLPEDFSLAGFDDLEIAMMMEPPLTTVHVPVDEVGRACVEMMVERMRRPGQPLPRRSIATRLVERASWGPAPRSSAQCASQRRAPAGRGLASEAPSIVRKGGKA